MSKRPSNAKKLRRLRKLINTQKVPAYLDLVQWLKDRRYAQTTGEAEKIILDERVRVDSHVIGIEKQKRLTKLTIAEAISGKEPTLEEVAVVKRLVPAEYRMRITVL